MNKDTKPCPVCDRGYVRHNCKACPHCGEYDAHVDNESFRAVFEAGFLWIENKATGNETATGLNNDRGQNITAGQFRDSIRTHGPDRACQTFIKLAA